jgi:hypothetical protein
MSSVKTEVLDALFDKNALELFTAIARTNDTSELYISKMNLSRKQFYGRMLKLRDAGLVIRLGGSRYALSSFGRLIDHIIKMIMEAKEQQWKLEAIDKVSGNTKQNLIRHLLDEKTKQILGEQPKVSTLEAAEAPLRMYVEEL